MLSKIFLSLGIAAALAAGYFAYTNYETRNTMAAKLVEQEGTITAVNAEKAKLETDIKTEKEKTVASEKKFADSEAALAETKQRVASLDSQLTAAKADADAKTATLTDLQKKVSDLTAQLGQVSVEDLTTQITTLTNNLQVAVKEKEEASAKAASMEQRLAALEKDLARRQKGDLPPGTRGTVQAVNVGWNFVIVNLGDQQGILPNVEMYVFRGETKVGKIKLTNVETRVSTGSILDGDIQPGDRVFWSGKPVPQADLGGMSPAPAL